jgi:predicted ATPase
VRLVPSTTVRRTFLFTDIESSTRLWDRYPDSMLTALEHHDRLVQEAISGAGGQVSQHTGDGFVASFSGAGAALDAALAAQRRLTVERFPLDEPIRVRMGIHSGDVIERDGECFGWALNATARLHALAHGGQIVVSGAAEPEARRASTEAVEFVDLGRHRLRDVAEPMRVYSVLARGLPAFDGVRGTAEPVAVPRALTSFVGRGAELHAVSEQVLAHRLVTLVGLAGVGKTRVATEAAAKLADRFPDGAVMCELAGVPPGQVGAALGRALGVERRTLRSTEQSVVEWLHDKHVLLVLDNCEDALEEIGRLVLEVSMQAPECHVLATSREALRVAGERVVPVRPLPADSTGDESVELFLDRARAAGGDVADDGPTRVLVLDICEAVAGVPLAIELAASNASSLSLGDILDAVRAGELPAEPRLGIRHRSVDDALDLTVARLDPPTCEAFLRCSVLPGSFDRAAFGAVVAPGVDGARGLEILRTLVDRSLLASETRRERTRFRLLEPVRRYADAHIAAPEREAAEHAFVRHYLGVAESASAALRGPDEARQVAQIELDFDNLRGAHAHALRSGDPAPALRIVAALWDYAFMRMRSEIFDWGEAASEATPPDDPARAEVLGIVALGGWIRESPAKTEQFAAESRRLERDLHAPASLPWRLALLNAAEYGGTTTDVRGLIQEVIELSAASASPYWQTNVDVVRSLGLSFAGRSAPALDLAERAMARARESENPSTMAWALFGRAVATELVDAELAEGLLDESLDRARSVDNLWIGSLCTTRLASMRRRRGSVRDAMLMVLELLDTWERAGHRSHLWSAIQQAALCLADSGDAETAVRLYHAAAAARLRLPLLPADTEDLAAALDALRARVGDDRMRRWEGRAAGLDQAAATRLARERLEFATAG